MAKFKQIFRTTLKIVKTQYPDAKFTLDGRGMTLMTSPPPIAKRIFTVGDLPESHELALGAGASDGEGKSLYFGSIKKTGHFTNR